MHLEMCLLNLEYLFYNQLTLIINSPTYKKLVNMKLFNNGNIQFTGLKDRYCAD